MVIEVEITRHIKPWQSDRVGEVNTKGQENGYDGFFQSFWEEEFVAGGFLWKWFLQS